MVAMRREELYRLGISKISAALLEKYHPNQVITIPYIRREYPVNTSMGEVCLVLQQLAEPNNDPIEVPLSFIAASEILGQRFVAYSNPQYTSILIIRDVLMRCIPDTEVAQYFKDCTSDDYSDLLFSLFEGKEVVVSEPISL